MNSIGDLIGFMKFNLQEIQEKSKRMENQLKELEERIKEDGK